jgi:DNA repair protein RadA/Sms
VSPAAYGTPQRSTTGYDPRRVNMLLAVLERRSGFRMGTQDVFLNLAGGLKVDDTSIDLAICTSIVSSMEDVPISQDICFAAEIGLGGELRGVPRIDGRISEAERLGFKGIFISSFAQKSLDIKKYKIEIKGFDKISKVFSELFG